MGEGVELMMQIKDLKTGTANVEVEAEIVDVEAPREVNKMGRALRVANVTLKDDTGTIALVLWNDNIDKVQVGDRVHITNGYVNSWQDKTQLTLGKFGKLDVI